MTQERYDSKDTTKGKIIERSSDECELKVILANKFKCFFTASNFPVRSNIYRNFYGNQAYKKAY